MGYPVSVYLRPSSDPLSTSSVVKSEMLKHNYIILFMGSGGRDSAVGIANRYGLDGPGIVSRWKRGFPHPSRPALGPTQAPVKWVPVLSRGVKRPGRGADPHPLLQYRGLKLGRAIPLPVLRDFVACIGRNFTFTFIYGIP